MVVGVFKRDGRFVIGSPHSCPDYGYNEREHVIRVVKVPPCHEGKRWESNGSSLRDSQVTCFAIVASDMVTSHLVLHEGKKLRPLAAQELLDCMYWLVGIRGSLIRSFDYICTHGLAYEKHFPYTGSKGSCKSYLKNNPTKIKNKEYYDTALNGALNGVMVLCKREGEHKAVPQLQNPILLGLWSVQPREMLAALRIFLFHFACNIA
ncbi:hypothetical protein RHMOL_Rhmol12G0160300 [Rhododendron molle]|uniref:Uncharacterized protein n=4 Tax=Rhododendron molle TaxID=49168 RepID=A0ACC0LKA8_RHOML|nr:hypothetical protein RHMOL_Rhmol12G0160300 [Rhododendron molle]KAI8528596.1 hypothetical protein RHMOL_Rhmol12G0160300 [Rhododendron molle]KAI8528597.1 hypothetical protein RHMOL_Rhmol12G0160300 [Rhododendron molle]KAI8528598.1 hypothetical protein RHMOL_Rhmol12G0160300 [Rhododendron molle]